MRVIGWGSRPGKHTDPVNRVTLLSLAKLEALRAGLSLLECDGDIELGGERMPLKDACGVLVLLRGQLCNRHVASYSGLAP